jgi:hypothetical protein
MLGGYPNLLFVSIFGATGADAFPIPSPRLLSAEAPVGSGPAAEGLGAGFASIARCSALVNLGGRVRLLRDLDPGGCGLSSANSCSIVGMS